MRAGIEQIEACPARAASRSPASPGSARSRRSGPAPEIVSKLRSRKCSPLAAEGFEPVAGGDLAQPALRRFAREPGEEAGDRGAVAAMRGAGAVELDRVLAGLRQQARVGGALDVARRPLRAGRRSTTRRSPDRPAPRPRAASASSAGPSRSGGSIATRVAEMALEAGGELAAVDEQVDAAVAGAGSRSDSGSGVCGTSPPRMLSSQAIESGTVSTAAATPSSASARPSRARFACGALAGEARRDAAPPARAAPAAGPARPRRAGCRRPARKLAAGALGARRASARPPAACAARVVAERCRPCASAPASQRAGGSSIRWRISNSVGVDLRRRLQRVAAVDEDRGAVASARSPRPAEPVKPVSQASRWPRGGTYSP